MFACPASVKLRSIGKNSGPIKTNRKSATSTTSAVTASLRRKKVLTAMREGLSSASTASASSVASDLLAPMNILPNQRPSVPKKRTKRFCFSDLFSLFAIVSPSFTY